MEDRAGARGPQAQPHGRQHCPSHTPQRVLCVWGVCLLTTRSPGPQRALHHLCRMNEWVGGWLGGWGGGCIFRPLHLQEECCVPR